MSKGTEPAFPISGTHHGEVEWHHGLSKREIFAMTAMQGILASRTTNAAQYKMDKEWTADEARAYADALIKALEESEKK